MCRKCSWFVLLALFVPFLLVSTAALAADEPPAPISREDFLAALEEQADSTSELPEVDGMESAVFLHGDCYIVGLACKACTLPNGASGLATCQHKRCVYLGVLHSHLVNCGVCSTICAV